MKRLLIITALFLYFFCSYSQTIQKGAVLGIHHFTTLEIKQGVTMEQFLEFCIDEYFPVYEKHFEGVTLSLMSGIKGKNEGELGMIYCCKDEKTYNKYYDPAGGFSEEGLKAWKQVQPFFNELLKLMNYKREFTDWVIL